MPYPTGDLNQDGIVNSIDLSILVSRWNSSDVDADLNGDGIVDTIDLSTLVGNWGATGGGDNPLLVDRESCIVFDPAYVSGATEALDLQQNVITPLDNGVTYTTDPDFTATSQWPGNGSEVVTIPGTSTEWNNKIGGEITLVALARWDGSANIGARLLSQAVGSGAGEQQYELGLRSGAAYGFRSRINVNGTRLEVTGWPASGEIAQGEAFVAAVTYDGSATRLYVARNSTGWTIELVGSTNGTGAIDSGSTSPVIGNITDGWNSTDNVWSGQIGMTGIWSRALSQQELQEIANSPIESMSAGYEPPPAPNILTGLSVSSFTHNSASLTWNAVTDATSYEIEVISGNTYTNISSTSYTVTGLSAQASYSIRARAVNSSGNGPWSDAVMVTTAEEPADTGLNILVDTDYNADVDDLMAHAQLFGHVYANECTLLGFIAASRCQWTPVAIERVNVWHGYSALPVGAWKGNGGPYDNVNTITSCVASWWSGYDSYTQPVSENYPGQLTTSTVPDSTQTYREVLSSQPDNSVTLLVIGYHTSLYDFLQSPGDGIDGRNGIELANAKIKKIVMGGSRQGGSPNFNFTQAPDYTRWILDNIGLGRTVNVPLVVQPNNNSEPGGSSNNMQVGSAAQNQPNNQIVRFAMENFIEDMSNFNNGHFAWDLMTVLACVRGDDWAWNAVEGTFTFPNGANRETWTAGAGGPHVRLENIQSTQFYIDEIDALIFHQEAN